MCHSNLDPLQRRTQLPAVLPLNSVHTWLNMQRIAVPAALLGVADSATASKIAILQVAIQLTDAQVDEFCGAATNPLMARAVQTMHKTRGAAGTQARMKWQASVKNQAKLSAANMRRAGDGSTTNTSKISSAAAQVCVIHAWCLLCFAKRILTPSTAKCAKLDSAAVYVLCTRRAVLPAMLLPPAACCCRCSA
jgi:hypothetical protein